MNIAFEVVRVMVLAGVSFLAALILIIIFGSRSKKKKEEDG